MISDPKVVDAINQTLDKTNALSVVNSVANLQTIADSIAEIKKCFNRSR